MPFRGTTKRAKVRMAVDAASNPRSMSRLNFARLPLEARERGRGRAPMAFEAPHEARGNAAWEAAAAHTRPRERPARAGADGGAARRRRGGDRWGSHERRRQSGRRRGAARAGGLAPGGRRGLKALRSSRCLDANPGEAAAAPGSSTRNESARRASCRSQSGGRRLPPSSAHERSTRTTLAAVEASQFRSSRDSGSRDCVDRCQATPWIWDGLNVVTPTSSIACWNSRTASAPASGVVLSWLASKNR